mmetsp:Transcript_17952/g.56287  ORF Transcript_17952/g.56287 Transcript_17952/m.56287 type:complete len:580 (-) Transcript_17952:1261-3000(-)
MVRGCKRDVEETVFVESTTGRIFPMASAPYLGVEAVFNAENYWVNMQGIHTLASELDLSLANSACWEHVLTDQAPRTKCSPPCCEVNELGGRAHAAMLLQKSSTNPPVMCGSLDLPSSWVSKITIGRGDFHLRYPPDGQRSMYYSRSKLELYTDNKHEQAMTMRVSLYKDTARSILVESIEYFRLRHDCLDKRHRYPLCGKTVEHFLPGRAFSLRQLTEISGRRRKLMFYVEARQDGLVCREDILGVKVLERFQGRSDRLVYRSVAVGQNRAPGSSKPLYTLPNSEACGELMVNKMAQKYSRLETSKRFSLELAKRTFYIYQGRIRTQYHYEPTRITRCTSHHVKGRHSSSRVALPRSHVHVTHSNLHADPRCVADVSTPASFDFEDQQAVLAAERDCLTEIRRAQLEVLELLRLRQQEESSFVIDRNALMKSVHGEPFGNCQEASQSKSVQACTIDYLTPFLQHVQNPNDMSFDEAQHVRDACLRSLKERLIERANILMTSLNEENAKLAKKQAMFQRNQRENDAKAEDEFEHFCSESMFRIQILEQRLSSHQEAALRKFHDLDDRLRADPRLRTLHE